MGQPKYCGKKTNRKKSFNISYISIYAFKIHENDMTSTVCLSLSDFNNYV